MVEQEAIKAITEEYKNFDLVAFYESRRISRADFANAIDVSERTLRRWEADPLRKLDFRTSIMLHLLQRKFPLTHTLCKEQESTT